MKKNNNIYHIKFFPYLTHHLTDIKSSLLVNKLEYWFSKDKFKQGFFKFIEPCQHRLYKEGDSWTETLNCGRNKFKELFDTIGVRYHSLNLFRKALKTGDPFQGKLYLYYFNRKENKTYFLRNHTYANLFFQNLTSSLSQKKKAKIYDKNFSITSFQKEFSLTKKQSCSVQNRQSPYTRINTYTLSSNEFSYEILSQQDGTDASDLERERKEKKMEKREKKIKVQTKRRSQQKEINQINKIKDAKQVLQTLETQGKEQENQGNEANTLKNNSKQEAKTKQPETVQPLEPIFCPAIRSDAKHSPIPLPQKREKEGKEKKKGSQNLQLHPSPNRSNNSSNSASKDQIFSVNHKKDQEVLASPKAPETSQKIIPQDLQSSRPQDSDKTCHTMITIWKKHMGPTPLWHPSKLFHKLKTALRCFFNNCLQTWEAFCAKIASSKFLMGEKGPFKIFLSWAIQPETIQRILNNGFTFGDREAPSDTSEQPHAEAQKKRHIQHRIDHLLQDDPTEEKTQLMEAFLTSDLPLNLIRNIKEHGINRGSFEESCFKSYLWKRFEKEMIDEISSKESYRLQVNPIGDML